jgi:hypothetical protein
MLMNNKFKPNNINSLSHVYDFTNIKSSDNIFLITNVLDLMLVKENIVLIFGNFKCYKNVNVIYSINGNKVISFSIEYNNKVIDTVVSDSDIYYIFYTWLTLNKKFRFPLNNISIKNVYHDWLVNVIHNNS